MRLNTYTTFPFICLLPRPTSHLARTPPQAASPPPHAPPTHQQFHIQLPSHSSIRLLLLWDFRLRVAHLSLLLICDGMRWAAKPVRRCSKQQQKAVLSSTSRNGSAVVPHSTRTPIGSRRCSTTASSSLGWEKFLFLHKQKPSSSATGKEYGWPHFMN